jgi:hypothetical protein
MRKIRETDRYVKPISGQIFSSFKIVAAESCPIL